MIKALRDFRLWLFEETGWEWVAPNRTPKRTPSETWLAKQPPLSGRYPRRTKTPDQTSDVCKHLNWSMSDQGLMTCTECKAPIFDWPERLTGGSSSDSGVIGSQRS